MSALVFLSSARVRYPFGKWKGENGKLNFDKPLPMNIAVVIGLVAKWYAN